MEPEQGVMGNIPPHSATLLKFWQWRRAGGMVRQSSAHLHTTFSSFNLFEPRDLHFKKIRIKIKIHGVNISGDKKTPVFYRSLSNQPLRYFYIDCCM